jgi:hypothetical protein
MSRNMGFEGLVMIEAPILKVFLPIPAIVNA